MFLFLGEFLSVELFGPGDRSFLGTVRVGEKWEGRYALFTYSDRRCVAILLVRKKVRTRVRTIDDLLKIAN